MSPPAPRPSGRTLPAWVRWCAWLVMALVLARAVAFTSDTATPSPAGWVAETSPLELAAVDDDSSDEALGLTPAVACPHDGGTAVVTFARRTDAMGSDPPVVPPPEA